MVILLLACPHTLLDNYVMVDSRDDNANHLMNPNKNIGYREFTCLLYQSQSISADKIIVHMPIQFGALCKTNKQKTE